MKKGTNTFGKLVHSVGRLMKKKKKRKKSGVFITLIIPPRLFSSSIMVDDRSREHISVIDSAVRRLRVSSPFNRPMFFGEGNNYCATILNELF